MTYTFVPGLILHGGNRGDCLRCPLPLPWCPWNAPVELYNFLIHVGCPLSRRKCLGALSKTKHTGLMYIWNKCTKINTVYMCFRGRNLPLERWKKEYRSNLSRARTWEGQSTRRQALLIKMLAVPQMLLSRPETKWEQTSFSLFEQALETNEAYFGEVWSQLVVSWHFSILHCSTELKDISSDSKS